jgi:hypothetical protein
MRTDLTNAPHAVCARVEHIFLSHGHNFFGHHGKAAENYPVVDVDQVNCVAGRGLEGDRFFDYKSDYPGQVTFFSMEVYEDLCEVTFSLQGLVFFGSKECSPCYWMDQAFGTGAEAFLKGRGGLRARICSSGILRRENGNVSP